MRLTATVILVMLLSFAGCQQTPPNHACSSQNIQRLTSAADLRAIAERCVSIIDAYAEAKERLNSLPPPQPSRLQLTAHLSGAVTEMVAYEADVFFDLLESYPPDLAFQKLEELLSRLKAAHEVISVEVTGYVDMNEVEFRSFDLARKRALFVANYFKAAGLQADVLMTIKTASPRHPDTLEGRARDRSASVLVLARRDRVKTPLTRAL